MGRISCAVTGCRSVKTPLSNFSFYRIYTQNRNVRAWIDFCENPDVTKNSQICSEHFKFHDFINPANKSQGIRRFAIPSLFPPIFSTGIDVPMDIDDLNNETPMDVDHVYFNEEIEIAGEVDVGVLDEQPQIPLLNKQNLNPIRKNVAHDHDYDIDVDKIIGAMERLVLVEQENKELRKKVRQNQKSMSKQKARIKSLRTEVAELKKSLAQQTKLFDPILLELQKNKCRKQRGARYSSKMKNMAVILQYCSSKAYRQMRKYFTLPSITTIRGWLSKLEVKEGYSKTVLQLLKLRASSLPVEERLVTIVMDEMSLTQRLTYVANAKDDYFVGFPTKVGNEQTNINQRASLALTIMVKSIKSGFKQAIGYFFNASSANSSRLHDILQEAIKVVSDTGLIPKVITCDQNSTNRMLYRTLGVCEDQPWIVHNNNKIYCIYDPPHLLKSSRNNILRHNAVFDGQICSFQHITHLFEEDVKHVPRTVPKLTYDHVNLAPYAEMNVGRAAQTLSESVSAGIKAYVHTKKLPRTYLSTANFCENFDKLFDCANSSTFKETKDLKRPLFENSPHWEFLTAMKHKLKQMRFISKDCTELKKESEFSKLPKQSRLPYFIDGWILYISAIEQLWQELRTMYGFSFLRTRNLSQDCIEHFFSIIRWKNANNNHPDASKFTSAYKAIVINQLIAPKKLGNVQADVSSYFVNASQMSKIKLIPNSETKSPQQLTSKRKQRDTKADVTDPNQLSSVHYTAGWVCSRLKHRECIERTSSDVANRSAFLIDLKRYKKDSRLFVPGLKMFQFCKKIVTVFERNFDNLLRKSVYGVKKAILQTVLWPYKSDDADELVYDVLCVPCATLVANKYINMLVKSKLQIMNMQFKAKDKTNRKNKKTKKEMTKRKKLNIR